MRIQRIIQTALLLLASLAAVAQAEDFLYTTNSGALTVRFYNGPGGNVAIPDHAGGLPVIGIANSAFPSFLPVTVSNITIPNTVTNIEIFAFTGCPGLTSLTVDAQNPSYAAVNGVVLDKDLKTLVAYPSAKTGTYDLPTGVASIADGAFAECQLLNITVPGSVTNIGNWAFAWCSLTNVTIGEGVDRIGIGAFEADAGLQVISVDPGNPFYADIDGVLFDKGAKTLVAFPGGRSGDYAVPNGVVRIGEEAFYYCSISVTIPASVTSIGNGAFSGCGMGSLTISSSLTNIEAYAFNQSGLTNLHIYGGHLAIGCEAFSSCQGLTGVSIAGGTVSIGDSAFQHCDALTNLMLADGVGNIGSHAFAYCYSLTNVFIPSTVTNIASRAFYYCSSLSAINVDTQNLYYASEEGVLFDKNLNVLLAYPNRKHRSYIESNYEIPEGVTSVADSAFAECRINSVTFPYSVTNIGHYAFYRSWLSWIGLDWNNSVITIGDYAFYKCGFSYINIPRVTSIGNGAFSESALKSISIPGTVTNIGSFAFAGCGGLASANIPNSITAINGAVFSSCFSLSAIAIPASITSIGNSAFNLTGLTNIVIPSSVTNIGLYAFARCSGLAGITVAAGNLFYASADGVLFDKNLTTIIQFPGGKSGIYRIPGGVFSIGSQAFLDCANLTNVVIPAGVTNVADYAFGYCDNLASVYFEGDAPAPGGNVFYGDNNATAYFLPWSTGWSGTFAGIPVELWKPQIQAADSSFGTKTNRFGFNIVWAGTATVVTEACTNLAAPEWFAVGTNTLVSGSSFFSDPDWSNNRSRFYRIRWPQ